MRKGCEKIGEIENKELFVCETDSEIENWEKSKKYDGTNPNKDTIWMNILPQYKGFSNNYYISVGGDNKDYYVSVAKSCKEILLRSNEFGNGFTTYREAVDFAIEYMKSHPIL